ncbi:alkaline phosphatase family protein [Aneurinibacillus sp. Ricciae_BoGa-3]|uniref:alkaline phosphatase family protein n=1 Tax=Aneurinibacillus sp. Ricciae_BoGa-3 TaxID=3022697 RepID=UPI0023425F09|nr:nucleotide pyrophosphatase/phosphodiesterase family protein [Aneurinibacillus sp. Ricciae_BoGa-3]WCK56303.1 alkaline phosphatase family protein [Aneurinibacillus sp. Ricciae_BoGa-3]
MPRFAKQVIVLNLVGLTPSHLKDRELTPNLNRIASQGHVAKIKPPFPPVTGTVQTTLVTGYLPGRHGIISNGLYDRSRQEVTLWEQTGAPIKADRIWDVLKQYDPAAKTAILFWQYIKYASADIVITPSPIHLEDGMQEWYFSKPAGLYEQVAKRNGPFHLHSFWGPLASFASSEWIARAALDIIKTSNPTLTMVYLPNLDYDAQRFGPHSEKAKQSVKEIDVLVGEFVDDLQAMGRWEDISFVLLSEYAIQPVSRPVFINRTLRDYGWLKVNRIGGKEYLDLYHSKAFALVDHQVAHIYVQDDIKSEVQKVLQETDGIAEVWGQIGKRKWQVDHANAGELVVVAERDAWFPYYWWYEDAFAPSFAHTVDIHRKPGYDPVELFFDAKTRTIPLKAELIKGSHGVPPTTDEDLVSIIVTGPQSQSLSNKEVWEAHEIPAFLLEQLGYQI